MDTGEPAAAPVGHVVLCGLNELGHRTLEELVRLGEDVVVSVGSPAEELARGARELGATLVPGNYRDQAVLRAAGVPVAGALVITEDDDVGNLHAALAAQELNPAMLIFACPVWTWVRWRQIEKVLWDRLDKQITQAIVELHSAVPTHEGG